MLKIIAAVLIFGIVIAIVLAAIKKKTLSGKWPFKKRKTLLTEPEQVLYWRLIEALPEMVVMAQTGLSRVIEVERSAENKMSWFGKIAQKSVDYVICKKDSTILFAIELDDGSHAGKNRQKADMDKTKAIEDAGIKLIRWNVKNIPSTEEIKKQFEKLMVEQTKQDQHASNPEALK